MNGAADRRHRLRAARVRPPSQIPRGCTDAYDDIRRSGCRRQGAAGSPDCPTPARPAKRRTAQEDQAAGDGISHQRLDCVAGAAAAERLNSALIVSKTVHPLRHKTTPARHAVMMQPTLGRPKRYELRFSNAVSIYAVCANFSLPLTQATRTE